MFTPEGEASPIKPLSLAEYKFDKAVKYFDDAKALRENELLQQFENGKVREEYSQLLKEGKMTYEELQAVLEGKKSEVVQEVVERRFLLSGKGLDSQSDSGYNEDTQNLGGINDDTSGVGSENAEGYSEIQTGKQKRRISQGRNNSSLEKSRRKIGKKTIETLKKELLKK